MSSRGHELVPILLVPWSSVNDNVKRLLASIMGKHMRHGSLRCVGKGIMITMEMARDYHQWFEHLHLQPLTRDQVVALWHDKPML